MSESISLLGADLLGGFRDENEERKLSQKYKDLFDNEDDLIEFVMSLCKYKQSEKTPLKEGMDLYNHLINFKGYAIPIANELGYIKQLPLEKAREKYQKQEEIMCGEEIDDLSVDDIRNYVKLLEKELGNGEI